MANADPLTSDEAALFGALMAIAVLLPRHLDADLVGSTGLTMNEYVTMQCIAAADGRETSVAELAREACVSSSRMSRLLDELKDRGLVEKRVSTTDGRGTASTLTRQGAAVIGSARPLHIRSVRMRVFDHLDPSEVPALAEALVAVAEAIADPDSGVSTGR